MPTPAEQYQVDVEHSAAILEAAGCDLVPLLRPIANAWNLLGVGAWPEMLGLQSSRFVLDCHDLEHGGRGMMFDFPRRGVNGGEAS